jgi:adenosylcobinamide-phosphate synthase
LKVLLAAIAVDAVAGEVPERVHPVAAMGRVLSRLERHAPSGETSRFVYGSVSAIALPVAWAAAGYLVERVAPWPLQAMFLKSAMAGRGLLLAGRGVEECLRSGDIGKARTELRALVSRPTQDLDERLIASAAVESLAENLVDSWVAPLLAYAVFGIGGAYFYRAVNTADAMWGYRTPEYEWLGKSCARLDDVLNWIPARLAAMMLIVCGPRPADALRVLLHDAVRTSSPNAGQAMAACAGQLGVQLEKSHHYVLNAEGRSPGADDIAAARHLVARGMLAAALFAVLLRQMLHP